MSKVTLLVTKGQTSAEALIEEVARMFRWSPVMVQVWRDMNKACGGDLSAVVKNARDLRVKVRWVKARVMTASDCG